MQDRDLAEECGAFGRAQPVRTDVGPETDVANLPERALSEFGRIDVWVNNAGAGAIGRFEDVPLEDYVKVIETDLLGTLYGSYFAITQFRRQGQGVLINVVSLIGKVHSRAGQNRHDSGVIPTPFDPPFFEHAARYSGKEASPIPPTYDPAEVIERIVSLATDSEDEVSVGTAAKVATLAHQFFPGAVESMIASQTSKAEFEDAHPGSESSGSRRRVEEVSAGPAWMAHAG